MNPDAWDEIIARLKARGIAFESGLTDAEVAAVESRFAFRFPPDLRAFLQTALPSGEEFHDWRAGDEAELRNWLDLPRQGIVFDIECNNFWLEEWGAKPESLAEAIRIAERLIAAAPRLIPLYAHRMMPAEPHLPSNPVFSVHQTDIIIYSNDLKDYLAHEFLMTADERAECSAQTKARPIDFWNVERFQLVRWGRDGSCDFDNSRGLLP